MDITCDMCGKPCQDQGTQGRGETNAQPHPPLPHDQPRPSYPTGTPASSPTASDLPAFTKTHRGTYQPNEPNQPSHIHPATNHALHTQQAPRPRPPSDLPTFTNLHATHGYTTLPGPHQTPRPRIRTTHALKTQTTSPKHPTFTQFHRSGLHFGRIHPQHRPICPHSPICTQPTDTPRCPAPNRHPGLASAPFMRSKRRPPRPNTPHSPNFTEVVCALGAHRTIGSTSKETQWMRIRSTPLRRTHTPPQVQTTLSAVDSLGVLSCASW